MCFLTETKHEDTTTVHLLMDNYEYINITVSVALTDKIKFGLQNK